MSLEFRDTNRYGPLDESRLERLEARLKGRLPDDYRAFLLQNNGGRPTLSRFRFVADDEEQESILEWFFAVHDQPYRVKKNWKPGSGELPPYFGQPLEKVWEDCESECPKAGVLPIGRDPGGNLIFIGYEGDRAGAVWWYDHEMESFTRLAETFTEFLSSLTALPPGNWASWLTVS